jgi:hypothetical protein
MILRSSWSIAAAISSEKSRSREKSLPRNTWPSLRPYVTGPSFLGHAELRYHLANQVRRHLKIIGGSARHVAEDYLFGARPASADVTRSRICALVTR